MDTTSAGLTGTHTTNGRPNNATSLTPFLALPGAADAVAFYRDVFGATVIDVTEMAGVVVHAELDFGVGLLQIGEPTAAYRLVAPPEGEDDCYSLGVFVPDTDAVVERAVSAGAVVREPVSTFVSGDRYASIRDPFGVRWSIMSRVEDISVEESVRRVQEWAAAASAQGA